MDNVFMAVQGLNFGLSPRALLYDMFPTREPPYLPCSRPSLFLLAHKPCSNDGI